MIPEAEKTATALADLTKKSLRVIFIFPFKNVNKYLVTVLAGFWEKII
jgi:hypothetical protein